MSSLFITTRKNIDFPRTNNTYIVLYFYDFRKLQISVEISFKDDDDEA